MKTLKFVLETLCSNDAVLGALIITKEGMMIESELNRNYDGETIGAFMSHMAATIKNALGSMGHTEFTRYVVASEEGKIYLVDLGISFLLAITPTGVDEGNINVALFQAANEIKKTGRLSV